MSKHVTSCLKTELPESDPVGPRPRAVPAPAIGIDHRLGLTTVELSLRTQCATSQDAHGQHKWGSAALFSSLHVLHAPPTRRLPHTRQVIAAIPQRRACLALGCHAPMPCALERISCAEDRPAFRLRVAGLAANLTSLVPVRTPCHGVLGAAARMALRRVGALPREVPHDAAVVAALVCCRRHTLLGRLFLWRRCRGILASLHAAFRLQVASLAANVTRLVLVWTLCYGVRDAAARMALRWIGALPSEMPHDATVVACLDSVTATATFATATSIRCGGLLARAASTVGLGLPTALSRSLLLDQIVQRHIQSRHRSDGKA